MRRHGGTGREEPVRDSGLRGRLEPMRTAPEGHRESCKAQHGEFRSKGDEAVPTASRQSEPTATSSPQTDADRCVFKVLSAYARVAREGGWHLTVPTCRG